MSANFAEDVSRDSMMFASFFERLGEHAFAIIERSFGAAFHWGSQQPEAPLAPPPVPPQPAAQEQPKAEPPADELDPPKPELADEAEQELEPPQPAPAHMRLLSEVEAAMNGVRESYDEQLRGNRASGIHDAAALRYANIIVCDRLAGIRRDATSDQPLDADQVTQRINAALVEYRQSLDRVREGIDVDASPGAAALAAALDAFAGNLSSLEQRVSSELAMRPTLTAQIPDDVTDVLTQNQQADRAATRFLRDAAATMFALPPSEVTTGRQIVHDRLRGVVSQLSATLRQINHDQRILAPHAYGEPLTSPQGSLAQTFEAIQTARGQIAQIRANAGPEERVLGLEILTLDDNLARAQTELLRRDRDNPPNLRALGPHVAVRAPESAAVVAAVDARVDQVITRTASEVRALEIGPFTAARRITHAAIGRATEAFAADVARFSPSTPVAEYVNGMGAAITRYRSTLSSIYTFSGTRDRAMIAMIGENLTQSHVALEALRVGERRLPSTRDLAGIAQFSREVAANIKTANVLAVNRSVQDAFRGTDVPAEMLADGLLPWTGQKFSGAPEQLPVQSVQPRTRPEFAHAVVAKIDAGKNWAWVHLGGGGPTALRDPGKGFLYLVDLRTVLAPADRNRLDPAGENVLVQNVDGQVAVKPGAHASLDPVKKAPEQGQRPAAQPERVPARTR